MELECTVLNIEDVLLLPGEEVTLEIPRYGVLPVGVLDQNGELRGYLGRNDVTCAPGSVSGQDLCGLLDNWEISKVSAKCGTYLETNSLKMVCTVELVKKEQLVAI